MANLHPHAHLAAAVSSYMLAYTLSNVFAAVSYSLKLMGSS